MTGSEKSERLFVVSPVRVANMNTGLLEPEPLGLIVPDLCCNMGSYALYRRLNLPLLVRVILPTSAMASLIRIAHGHPILHTVTGIVTTGGEYRNF